MVDIGEKYRFHKSNTIEIKMKISGHAKSCRLHSYSDVFIELNLGDRVFYYRGKKDQNYSTYHMLC